MARRRNGAKVHGGVVKTSGSRYSRPMNMLSLTDVSVTVDAQPLFHSVTLGIDAGERIGFVGPNGSGKTTFLRLLGGEIQPESGTVARNRELVISGVSQKPLFDLEMTLDDFLFESDDPIMSLVRDYERCLHDMQHSALAARQFEELSRRMETEGGFTVEHTFRSYCRELGLDDTGARMGTLSGGMMKKAAIARSLASGANFLLLDEPTNHLDIETIEWLENTLHASTVGFVLVTHDRYVLDAVCTSILELDQGRIHKYSGSYADYVERKAAREDAAVRGEKRRESILRGELEWLRRGPKARTSKDKKRKERIQNLMDSRVTQELSMQEFTSSHRRLGKKVLELRGVAKSYDGRQVVSPFTYSFRRGERIGVIGPNGSGKSTFLELIAGRRDPDQGSITPGENTAFAYFDQTGRYVDGTVTVLDYMKEKAERITMPDGSSISAESFLDRFLFPRSMLSLPLERLSGGEFRRLYLIRLLAGAPNFLLLDEPTNDLDIETIRLLERYLEEFAGCMLIVSHDRALLDHVTDYLFVFDGSGGIRGFVGTYAEYRAMLSEESAARAQQEREASRRKERAGARREEPAVQERRRLSYREQQEYEHLLEEIGELEAEQKELEHAFSKPVRSEEEMERTSRRYHQVIELISDKLARWEELGERLAE